MKIRCIEAGTVSGIRSQAIYHGLAYARTPATPDTVVLVTPGSPYMCIGYFQDAGQEIDLAWCRDHQLPVIRRETGGGAVYIDDGQLFVQWIFDPRSLPVRVDQRFQLFIEPLVETYKFFGIEAYYHPINDVHVAGRKIVGTGAGTIGEAQVVTGNFLFDFDFDTMLQAVNLPSQAFRQAVQDNLNKYLTTMTRELERLPAREEIAAVYRQKCAATLGVELQSGDFTDAEWQAIEEQEARLSKEEWLIKVQKQRPDHKLFKIHLGVWIGQVSKPYDGGQIGALVTLNEGLITGLELSWEGLERPYTLAEITTLMIGHLAEKEELIDLLMPVTGADDSLAWAACINQVYELQKLQTGNVTRLARRN